MRLDCVEDVIVCIDIRYYYVVILRLNHLESEVFQSFLYIRGIFVNFVLIYYNFSGHFAVFENNNVSSKSLKKEGGLPKTNNPLLMALVRDKILQYLDP